MKRKAFDTPNARYIVIVQYDGYSHTHEKSRIKYALKRGSEVLFHGNDLYIPCHKDPESLETIYTLLDFLTQYSSDIDYTPAQLAFVQSSDAEHLSIYAFDYHEKQYRKPTRKYTR